MINKKLVKKTAANAKYNEILYFGLGGEED